MGPGAEAEPLGVYESDRGVAMAIYAVATVHDADDTREIRRALGG